MSEQIVETVESETEMEALGARLAHAVLRGGVIGLHGNLGAGKTTLSRGFLHGLGHKGAVKSPTFTVVEPYELQSRSVFHFDLYRIADPEELSYIGLEDYFFETAICLIEWPEKGKGVLPTLDVTCDIEIAGDQRRVTIDSHTALGDTIINHAKT